MSDGRDGVYIHIICASRCCVMCRVLLCRAVSSWVCAAARGGAGLVRVFLRGVCWRNRAMEAAPMPGKRPGRGFGTQNGSAVLAALKSLMSAA